MKKSLVLLTASLCLMAATFVWLLRPVNAPEAWSAGEERPTELHGSPATTPTGRPTEQPARRSETIETRPPAGETWQLAGLLLDQQGNRVSGVTVDAQAFVDGNISARHLEIALPSARSEADGSFHIPLQALESRSPELLSVLELRLEARQTRRLEAWNTLLLSEVTRLERPLELVLKPLPQDLVEGLVTSESGAVVADARVHCFTWPHISDTHVRTGPDGRFRLSPSAEFGISPQLARSSHLVAYHPEHGWSEPLETDTRSEGTKREQGLELRLNRRLAMLQGRVLGVGGGPLEGIGVTIEPAGSRAVAQPPERPWQSGSIRASTRTDADGNWSIAGMAPGQHRVHIAARARVIGTIQDPLAARELQAGAPRWTTQLALVRIRPRCVAAGSYLSVGRARLAAEFDPAVDPTGTDNSSPLMVPCGRSAWAPPGINLLAELAVPGFDPATTRLTVPAEDEIFVDLEGRLPAPSYRFRIAIAGQRPPGSQVYRILIRKRDQLASPVRPGGIDPAPGRNWFEGGDTPIELPSGSYSATIVTSWSDASDALWKGTLHAAEVIEIDADPDTEETFTLSPRLGSRMVLHFAAGDVMQQLIDNWASIDARVTSPAWSCRLELMPGGGFLPGRVTPIPRHGEDSFELESRLLIPFGTYDVDLRINGFRSSFPVLMNNEETVVRLRVDARGRLQRVD